MPFMRIKARSQEIWGDQNIDRLSETGSPKEIGAEFEVKRHSMNAWLLMGLSPGLVIIQVIPIFRPRGADMRGWLNWLVLIASVMLLTWLSWAAIRPILIVWGVMICIPKIEP
jgi:hypothetical protein